MEDKNKPKLDSSKGNEPADALTLHDRAGQYWRANLRVLAVLLSIWFVVSYGFGILLVDWLDQFQFFGFKLGFWFAQQGAIYVFVVLILVYTLWMQRLERKLGFADEEQG